MITWDDSVLRQAYSNCCNVICRREEIILEFETSPAKDIGSLRPPAKSLTNIILNPYTAKKFTALLLDAVRDFEAKYAHTLSRPPATHSRMLPVKESGLPAHIKIDGADMLLQQIRMLGVRYDFEYSFKLLAKKLLGNRFLFSITNDSKAPQLSGLILQICNMTKMPHELSINFKQKLPCASHVHFGYEEDTGKSLFKSYLEFAYGIKNEESLSQPFILYLGYKWDPNEPTKYVTSEYLYHPLLPVQDILEKVSNIYAKHSNPYETVKSIIEIASTRVPSHKIFYLDVTEKENQRKSFDINIYPANLHIAELYPLLWKACQYYSIPPDEIQTRYETSKDHIFGHLSGGIDREGRDFLTIYHGCETQASPGTQSFPRERSHRVTPNPPDKVFVGVELTDPKANMLFELVRDLRVKTGFERSFKITQNRILSNRFLIGLQSKSSTNFPLDVTNICRQLDMPEDYLEIFCEHLYKATIILFGFEGTEQGGRFKVYLEFGDNLEQGFRENNGNPVLIHLGFKWSTSNSSSKSLAKYTWFPLLTTKGMLERITSHDLCKKSGALAGC